jgi:hypothetical protein
MIRGIDHLVIACEDPDAAAAEVESALGVTCAGGGRHPGSGTRNRIAWMADGSYIELVGVTDREAAAGSPVGAAALHALDEAGGGLATYALRVDDLDVTRAGLQAAGSTFGAPIRGSRTRDDGELVEWWTSMPAAPLTPTLPFLIQHVNAGIEWSPAALAERARFAHPIGSPVLLARLDLAAADPPSLAADLHRELEVDFWAVADLAVADIGPHVIRLIPRREMAVPAVITLAADVPAPRTAELLGIRFDVETANLPVPEVYPA